MSFLSEILNKKSKLKQNETRITTSSGLVYKEFTTSSGERVQVPLDDSSPGYVIDEKPDKQVAQILPWLCMGSQDVAADETVLREHGITHVLSLGVAPPIQFDKIIYQFLPIYDEPNYDIRQHFSQCFTFIDTCYHGNQTNETCCQSNQTKETCCQSNQTNEICRGNQLVFVHCNAGISRSASVVIAYLMKHLGMDLSKAFDRVRQARPCVKPNEGFMRQLRQYEYELALVKDTLPAV